MSTATLTWTPPTTRTDGSALAPADIAGADVYDQSSPTPAISIGSVIGAVGTFMTGTLTVGNHAFTVITRDVQGHSSAASNIATVTIAATLAAPSAIVDLVAMVNA